MAQLSMTNQQHPDELLPWYVNQSLSDHEREEIEVHALELPDQRLLPELTLDPAGEIVRVGTRLSQTRLMKVVEQGTEG